MLKYLVLLLMLPLAGYSQSSSFGTDFWIGFIDQFDNSVTYKVSISSDAVAANGTVAVPGQGWSAPFAVAAGATTVIAIPAVNVFLNNSEVVTAKAVHITSNNPVTVIASTNTAVRTETSIILPTSLAGTQYYVASYEPGAFNFASEFAVAATQNGTSVDITVMAPTVGGKSAGSTFTVNLNAGDVYQVKAGNSGSKDLTGSKVVLSASTPCKPFVVFSGMNDTYVPVGCATADPLLEQMYPLNYWGTDYTVPPFFSSGGSQARIIASQNGTNVSIDGVPITMLNAGQFSEQSFNNNVHCITADKPITVAQYLKGNECSGAVPNKGDPSMILLSPNNLRLNRFGFTPYNTLMATRYVNVVMPTAYTSQFKIDGVTAGTFNASPCTGYSSAIISLGAGYHTLVADSGFIGYAYGYGTGDESFANSMGFSTLTTKPVMAMQTDANNICPSSCANISAIVTPGFTFNYSWSPNIGTTAGPFSVCPPTITTYYLTAISACDTLKDSITIVVKSCATPTVNLTAASICAGNCTYIVSTVSGGTPPLTYSWSAAGAGDSIQVCPGITTKYYLTVTDALGNTATDSADVTVIPIPSPSITGSLSFCIGDSTVLDAGSGYNAYQWSTGASTQTLIVTTPGNYSVFVTGTGNCIGGDSVTVTVSNNLTPIISGPNTICSGDSVILDAGAGYTSYSWSTTESSQTIAVYTSGTYSVTVSNSSGCSGTASKTITSSVPPVPSISGDTTICFGQSTVLSTGSYNFYSWSTGQTTQAITVSSTGIISVTVTDGNGCSNSASTFVNVIPPPFVDAGFAASICKGDSTILNATGNAVNYSWTPSLGLSCTLCAHPTTKPTQTTLYTVVGSDASGCLGVDTVSVIVAQSFMAEAGIDQHICTAGNVILTANPADFYSWTPSTTLSCSGCQTPLAYPSLTTTYTLVATVGSCSAVDSVTVFVEDPIVTCGPDSVLCEGTYITLSGSGAATYSWWPAYGLSCDTCNMINVSPATDTTYYVLGTDIYGCSNLDSIKVRVKPAPEIFVGPDTTIIYGSSLQLFADGAKQYRWTPATGLDNPEVQFPIATPEDTTLYCVTILDSNGCSSTDCMRVNVDYLCGDVFVPNAFSPNSDGENDVACVLGNCIISMLFTIYDRWGEKIFETTDPHACWNGIYHNEEMNTAVFAYTLKANLITGKTIEKKGNISLIR